MNRRDALLRLSALLGGTIFGADRFLSGVVRGADTAPGALLAADDLALLNEVAESILPTTADSAGAKAADVAAFMQEIARDFYDARERELLIGAPAQFNAASAAKFSGRSFVAIDAREREQLLLELDRTKPQPEFYRMVKQLTIWGYFSSEVGAKQALNYVPVPGMYQGCIDVAPDAKAWANT